MEVELEKELMYEVAKDPNPQMVLELDELVKALDGKGWRIVRVRR